MKISETSPEPINIEDDVLNIDSVHLVDGNTLSIKYFKLENGKSILKKKIISFKGKKDIILLDKQRKVLLELSHPYYYELRI